MNQDFHSIATRPRRLSTPRASVVGLVVVATLLLGSLASGARAATPKTITLGMSQNATLVTVNPGTHINVSLTSSNWTFSTQGSRVVVKYYLDDHQGRGPGRDDGLCSRAHLRHVDRPLLRPQTGTDATQRQADLMSHRHDLQRQRESLDGGHSRSLKEWLKS